MHMDSIGPPEPCGQYIHPEAPTLRPTPNSVHLYLSLTVTPTNEKIVARRLRYQAWYVAGVIGPSARLTGWYSQTQRSWTKRMGYLWKFVDETHLSLAAKSHLVHDQVQE